jgi:endonuclease/exonuclease/phosphatase family metal-dependent hydrolase
MKRLLIILALVGGVACGLPFGNLAWVQAEDLCVVSYNVENLFHPKHDTVVERVSGLEVSGLEVSGLEVSGLEEIFIEKDDWEWTPEGERRWSYSRYYRKVENIARVLTNIGEWDGVDVVGLQEVENALCVKRLCTTLRRGEYDFVHYESPDRRGIDVALLYKKARIDTIATRAIRVSELMTRDILYVCARVDKRDTMHVFVCHLPSQRGGKAESEWKRQAAKQVLQQAVDSVYGTNPNAKIIVMGDMNSGDLRMRGLEDERMKGEGTHKYQGRWTFLDHFYVSPSIDSISEARIYDAEWIQETDEKYMGLKPKRTYNGFRYQNGFSDHLPIVLTIKNE